MTANTITSSNALRRECEAIARHGHALDREEFIDGLVAAAVPVRDAAGEVRGAIAVHAPIARMSAERVVGCVPALHGAAKRVGEQL